MRSATILAGTLAVVGGAWASDVLDLTAGSFKGEVMDHDLALVEFFAPWCGHCKNLAPHYEEAATELKGRDIKLAKVDCTAEQSLCADYGVNGYPTLKVFRNGVPTDYTGPRKADGIVSYMVKQSLPAVSDVTSSTHDEFVKSDKVVLVAYGDASHPIPEAFTEYANTARDTYLFGQYTDSAPSSLPSEASVPSIVLWKQFDEGYTVLPASDYSSLSAATFAEFVKTNSVPLLDEISPENFGSYAEQGLPIAYLFIEPEDTNLDSLVEALRPVAKQFKGKANFVWIDAVKFIDHGKSLNLPGDSWPAFVVQNLAEQTKYPMSGSVSASTVKSFMDKFTKGEIQPSIKSEDIPAQQEGGVYKLVANDWDNLFGDDSQDVFAEFYAPWCGHCQRLAPIWETLGEKYKNSGVVVAQMDATANDIPPTAPFKVQGFPTLKFRPAGSGLTGFIDYQGDRSLENLIEFIEANRQTEGAAVELDGDEDEAIMGEVEDDEDEGNIHDEL